MIGVANSVVNCAGAVRRRGMPVGLNPTARFRARAAAFTLIELLVVISIIVLLIAILLPAIMYAQREGYISATTSNMKSISIALQQYHADM
ncbi:MAG: type II secretion system protein, partial [Phycisphaerae bacterium]